VTTVFFALPSNVVSAKDGGALRRIAVQIGPQGWAFFTKSPHSTDFVPLRVAADGGLVPALAPPQSKAENLFGLSRAQRSQGPELAYITDQVVRWEECSADRQDCRERALGATASVARNTSPVPTLCGDFVLVETAPVPWSFRHDFDGYRLDKRAALVRVVCGG
jgi:antimicrobial peptide system SdpA family protein